MKFNLSASHASNTACILLLGMSSLMSSAAYAASDACCGDPLTCFCYKAENGDWKKGGLAKIPPKAQTKGLQFKEAGHLTTDKKTQAVSSETIFDRWGNLKTKKACDVGGGVWDGGTGQVGCTGPRTGSQK